MAAGVSKRKAYFWLGFLTLLNVLNFVDRQLIPSLGPKLIDDLGLNKAEIGLLYGFAFVIFYTVMGMFLGTAADRFHRPRLIAMGVGLWSLLTAASGAARGFWHLAIARVFVGVGEATLTPASMSILSDVFPPKKRGFASGFYYGGVPLGSGLSFIVAGTVAPDYGWRMCFYLLGAVGLVFVPMLASMKNPKRGEAEAAERGTIDEPPAERPSFWEIVFALRKAIVSTPALGLAILGGSMINYTSSSGIHVLTWLVQERGFEFRHASYLSGTIYAIAGFTGVALGGYLSDWFHARWDGGRLWFVVVKSFLFLPAVVGFYTLPESGFFYFCWFLSSLQSTTWYGPIFATVQDLAPAKIRATIVGFLLFSLNMLGSGPGPFITGVIADRTTIYQGLLSAVVVGYLALIPLTMGARRYARDKAQVQE